MGGSRASFIFLLGCDSPGYISVKAKLISGETVVHGDQWPMLVYEDKYDPEEPWHGLFRSKLLVWVCYIPSFVSCIDRSESPDEQAYKHIFTSPSSVEKEVKATRSGNARLHGMTRVTTASLAYIATQVRLAASFHHQTARLLIIP